MSFLIPLWVPHSERDAISCDWTVCTKQGRYETPWMWAALDGWPWITQPIKFTQLHQEGVSALTLKALCKNLVQDG